MSESVSRKRSTKGITRLALSRVRKGVAYDDICQTVYENGGLDSRYITMTVMSAAIAVLGLMLNSPAVVIGAMLVSPMMGPIVALGFSVALLDLDEMQRAVKAIAIGIGVALLVAVILTGVSPLKEPTSEILARTRPNFFDLLIAVFSGLAGAYGVIRQRGDTVIGVAIATALMPPIATVGFGLGTGDLRIAGGAFYLFLTNLVAIALAATLTAGFFGFRPKLATVGGRWRGVAVVGVLVLMSIPLGFSLRNIAQESRVTAETRVAVEEIFRGADSRITQLESRSHDGVVTVSALVSTREIVPTAQSQLQSWLAAALHIPVEVSLDQIVVADPEATARNLQASQAAPDPATQMRNRLVEAVPFETEAVLYDGTQRVAIIQPRRNSGLDLRGTVALERGLSGRFEDVSIRVIPALQRLEPVDLGDPASRGLAIWALARWRAEPAISLCRPEPAPDPAEGEERGPDAGESFIADLAAAGVRADTTSASLCRNGDRNLARIALAE
ncbi:MAG: DUF389 domain-containing protein [Caulobacterales bacterium]|nr:DUF389 domain-containing protein [Caulobacterales bacterium]